MGGHALQIMVVLLAATLVHGGSPHTAVAEPPSKPNIVFILADDLGYGDLGCYGQQQIRTPRIDRLATEGRRFLDCYAGSTVCAPSRCVLMTGLHTGHARVRGNALVPLEPEDVTVAEILRAAGYATGIIGKWGLGEPGTTGVPTRQGFDDWFGYLNQRHAHNYYPDYLWRNEDRVPLDGNANGKREAYSSDLFVTEALAFLDRQQEKPFFLYLALTLPHANNELGRETGNGMEVPDHRRYADRDWPAPQKDHAAMISRLDDAVGQVLDRLEKLGLAENTIVFFSSDNGPHSEGGADASFFRSAGPLRGKKRDLTEGGIRVPMIVRWPGVVPAGTESTYAWGFCDVLPTLAVLAGATAPEGLDGISIVPALVDDPVPGNSAFGEHPPLYWEFHERGFQQAVRVGQWKAIRQRPAAPLELYDLSRDVGEERDVAAQHPEIVARCERLFATSRTDSPHWRVPD
ncbi:MAG: arylsulfatase [Pirellulales bacterium]|nr:arylsulfatase [Pirellulales bacterium]